MTQIPDGLSAECRQLWRSPSMIAAKVSNEAFPTGTVHSLGSSTRQRTAQKSDQMAQSSTAHNSHGHLAYKIQLS